QIEALLAHRLQGLLRRARSRDDIALFLEDVAHCSQLRHLVFDDEQLGRGCGLRAHAFGAADSIVMLAAHRASPPADRPMRAAGRGAWAACSTRRRRTAESFVRYSSAAPIRSGESPAFAARAS